MPWPFDKKPTEEDLARWRREFEAARSFEDADDEKYAFRPLEQPTAQNASRVISRNPFSRIAAAQKWEEPARAVVPPRQPKHSMPQYYDPATHDFSTESMPPKNHVEKSSPAHHPNDHLPRYRPGEHGFAVPKQPGSGPQPARNNILWKASFGGNFTGGN
ncbi:hypothetical protein CERZMDRAFT_97021 [Cercospora zeae-maydis SCOH1-5]|uniref:Uncharacterized protein n=1 Tax=Cercospora zeae-maydis SCOH1-5 TaxID=717836 RepID=A0A6A6FGL1_9PEZI|nr:hypothetical protein CERZMDRAFT_97021 [Cercospora zeae-maydis SCOH1-5]